jgi:bifunctional DNA-binding transcriptional regulator/antitoxin component of YhaV-PrlF toxin-antitoxin module
MSKTATLQLAQRGLLTIPKSLREKYDMNPGDDFTLIDLGGVFVLSPGRSRVNELADRISDRLKKKGETLESMLATLRVIRERNEG